MWRVCSTRWSRFVPCTQCYHPPLFYSSAGRSYGSGTRSPRAAAGYQAPPDTPEFADFREASDNSLFFAGPADHLRQRRLVAAAFSPKAIERMREETREITRQALASLPDDDVVNLAAVADTIPLRVIGRMIDIPADREAAFLTFAKARVALISPVLPPDVASA